MKFTSIEQFKERAQFFPKGRIIPARILKITKGNRRLAHCATFGADSWAIPVNGAYVLACDTAIGGSAIRLDSPLTRSMKDVRLQGSPYSQGGTSWMCNDLINETKWLESINMEIAMRELMK